MSEGFYKISSEVLKFRITKDLNKIIFNHYLCQKENLQRISGDLPCGQFYLTINSISKDLEITFAEARGLLKKFTELNIITNVYTPPKGSIKPSIWQYNFLIFSNNGKSNGKSRGCGNGKLSEAKDLGSVDRKDFSSAESNGINNSKKDNLKRIFKNKKNNIKKSWRLITDSYSENEELKTAILEFIEMRKTIKKPMTERALTLILNKLDKLTSKDEEKIEILNQSIENSWQGVFPLKNKEIACISVNNKSQDYNKGYGWDHVKQFT